MKNIKIVYLYIISLILIYSCNEIKKEKTLSFIDSCEETIDSMKYSKFILGDERNLDILNGIKCFEFNSDFSKFSKYGESDTIISFQINHTGKENKIKNDTSYIQILKLTINDINFFYKNINWNKIELYFLKNKLSGIHLLKNEVSPKEISNFYNDFTKLLGNPIIDKGGLVDTILLHISNDELYKRYNFYSHLNTDSIFKYEIQNGFPNNLESEQYNSFSYAWRYNKKYDNKSFSNGKFLKLYYYYKSKINLTWKSNSILEVILFRDNPFKYCRGGSITDENRFNKLYAKGTVYFYPLYDITLSYYKNFECGDFIYKSKFLEEKLANEQLKKNTKERKNEDSINLIKSF